MSIKFDKHNNFNELIKLLKSTTEYEVVESFKNKVLKIEKKEIDNNFYTIGLIQFLAENQEFNSFSSITKETAEYFLKLYNTKLNEL